MTNPYTTKTIANYNTSPPADDASAVASNQLFWAKHKDKLADPIKTLAEAINTENLAAHAKFLGYVTNAQSTTYSVVAGDEWKIIECTGTFTLTLLPSATAGDGFPIGISNVGTGVITVEGDGSELVGGALNQSLAKTGDSLILQCNGTNHKILADSRTSYEVAINEAKGTDIASATTTDIGAATGNYVEVTGTTTITGLGTIQAGTRRVVRFTGALILTHNATSLILPGGANITTSADDRMEFISLGAGNWLCTNIQLVSGGSSGSLIGIQTFTASGTWTPTAGTASIVCEVRGSGGGGAGASGSGATAGRAGGGGGQGGRAIKRITSFGATETVTVAVGGTAGIAANGNGGTGGTVSLGALISATGGTGGLAMVADAPHVSRGGAGGAGSGGDIDLSGAPGGNGVAQASSNGCVSGEGGGEGGGQSVLSVTSTGTVGTAGVDGGGGAGGASGGFIANGRAGGAGGDGYVIIYEYS